MTDESQDVTYTLEWTDESGVNLERFLDYIDPNRNGNIQEEDERVNYHRLNPSWTTNVEDYTLRDSNEHEVFAISYLVNEDETTDTKAVVEITYRIPQGQPAGQYDLNIPEVYDKADNGGWVFYSQALEVESDTENDPPAYELISVSAQEVDVTTEDAEITVVFKITDETGLEERQLPDAEGATQWYQPGVLTEEFDDNVLYTELRRPVCQQSLYLDSPSNQAYWSYADRYDDYDGDGTLERFLQVRHDALNVQTWRSVDEPGRDGNGRLEGDNKDGTYRMTIEIDKGAYPGLYRLELDTSDADDEYGNNRWSNNYNCFKEDDDNVSDNGRCSIIEGDDVFYQYIRVINTRIEAPEEDY